MAKKKKMRIPKKVAGVKIPKLLRQSYLLRALLENPTGREIVAKALVAAAGAAAAVLVKEREEVEETGETVANKGMRGIRLAREAAQSATHAVADVVADAARKILPLETKDEDGSRDRAPSRH